MRITVVGPADLPELLPLVRAYCDFYQVAPSDRALLELSQALLADPQREGLQLPARDDAGRVVGFATLYWTWQTLVAARVGVMNDLFVAAEARGTGVADALIAACLERCRGGSVDRLLVAGRSFLTPAGWSAGSSMVRVRASASRVAVTPSPTATPTIPASSPALAELGEQGVDVPGLAPTPRLSYSDMLSYFVAEEPLRSRWVRAV